MLSSSTFPTRPVFPGGGFVFLTRACDFSRHYFDRRRRWRHVASGVQYARARPSPGGRSGGGRAHGVSAGRRVRLSSPAPVRTRGRRGHCIIPPPPNDVSFIRLLAPPPTLRKRASDRAGAAESYVTPTDRSDTRERDTTATIGSPPSTLPTTRRDDTFTTIVTRPYESRWFSSDTDAAADRWMEIVFTYWPSVLAASFQHHYIFFIFYHFFFLQFFTSCVCTYILRCLVGRLITENRDWNNIVFYTDGFVFENYTHEQRNVFCMV